MELQPNVITLGVTDLDEARRFYTEGLGLPILKDEGQFVSLDMGDGSSGLALYRRDALAHDAGVPADGSGFRGVTLSYITDSADHVDGLLAQATAAGGRLVKPAKRALWGGYSGNVADPDGHIWKVTSSNGPPRLRRRSAEAAAAPTEPSEVPVVIGVADVKASKAFYEALGSPVGKSYGGKYVSFAFPGASDLALYKRADLADDAGVDAYGRGFRAVTFSHIVDSAATVDEVIARATQAGATVVKPAEAAPWGGYGGYVADIDGFLWKVVSGS
jgi:uncharacterized glyoxalase superfamily protein PhnB